MASTHLIALSNAREGRESEYQDWYVNQHLKDICALDMVHDGAFHVVETPNSPWQYMGLYEIDDGSAEALLADIGERRGTQRMPVSDAIDSDTTAFFFIKGFAETGTPPEAPTRRLLALSGPLDGRQAELDTWYADQHIGDVVALDGFESAELAEFLAVGRRGLDTSLTRACLYEATAPEAAALLTQLRDAAGTAAMPLTDAMDRSMAKTLLFRILAQH